MGEHIDYNDGFVMPAAMDRRLSIVAGPISSDEIILCTEQDKKVFRFRLNDPLLPRGDWTDYVVGVLAHWMELNASVCGLAISIASDIPLGAGLSSSAALEVATATLLEVAWEMRLHPRAKALACQAVENHYVGMPCGIMDQFAVTMADKGHFLLLDCQTNTFEQIPIDSHFPSLLVINTNIRHALTEGCYAERRSQCESVLMVLGQTSWRSVSMTQLMDNSEELSDVQLRRGRHVISEIKRTRDAADCVRKGNMMELGKLLYASHQSLRYDYEVSCKEADWIVDRMGGLGEGGGVLGCRMTGAGFGGCVVCLVSPDAVSDIIRQLDSDYRKKFNLEADFFLTSPSEGCRAWIPS
jgi:galactokinase